MSQRTCGDCLFMGASYKWEDQEYCNLRECHVDYDNPACSSFLDDSHDCCYDCDCGKDMGVLGFYCKKQNKKIHAPGSFYCYRFED